MQVNIGLIEQCLEQATSSTVTDQMRTTARQTLEEYEKTDANFIFNLLTIYYSPEQQRNLKQQALILIKNTVQRQWNYHLKNPQTNKTEIFIKEEQKTQFRRQIMSLVQNEPIPILKNQFTEIAIAIAKYDYPFRFKELIEYFNVNMDIDLFYSVTKQMHQGQNDNNFLQAFWAKLILLYNPEKISKIDKVMTSFICTFNHRIVNDQAAQLFAALIDKTQKLIQTQNVEPLIYLLMRLQIQFPFYVHSSFPVYLQILQYQIKQQTKARSALIALIRILTQFEYFCTEEKLAMMLKTKDISVQIQIRMTIITALQQLDLNSIIDSLLMIIGSQKVLDDEELIEQEEETDLSAFIRIKEASVHSLSIILCENLLLIFQQQLIPYVANYLAQIQQMNFAVQPHLLHGVLSIIGVLPKVHQKLQLQLNLDIYPLVNFLQSSNNLVNLRRLVIVFTKFQIYFDQQGVLQMTTIIINLCQHQDILLQYLAFSCIKVLMGRGIELPWAQLLQQLCQQIGPLLQKLEKKPNLVSPLIELLQALISKACANQQDLQRVVSILQQSKIMHMTSSNTRLIISQVCEMIKAILISLPQGVFNDLHLFAVNYVKQHLEPLIPEILSLLLFVCHELNSVEPVTIFQFSDLLKYNDIEISCISLQIVEELIVFDQVVPDAFPTIIFEIEKKYQLSSKNSLDNLKLKSQCLSLISILILKSLNLKLSLSCFGNLVIQILSDFLSHDQMKENKFRLELQLTSILNRFILTDIVAFVALLNQFQILPATYFEFWMKNSHAIDSLKARKLNMLAILQFIFYIPHELFQTYALFIQEQFQALIQKQQHQRVDNSQITSTGYRLSKHRSSMRAEELRNTQMYEEVNMESYYAQQISTYCQQHNFNI